MHDFYLHQQVASFSSYLLCVILKTKSINHPQVIFCKAGWNENCALGQCYLNFLCGISNKLVQKLYQRLRTGRQSSRHEKLWVGEGIQRSQKPAGAYWVKPSPRMEWGEDLCTGDQQDKRQAAPQPIPSCCVNTLEN